MERRVYESETATVMAAELAPAAILAIAMQVEVVPDYEDTAARKGASDDFQEGVESAGRALLDDAAHSALPRLDGAED